MCLVASELVPIDKMQNQNVVRYDDYCGFVRGVASHRIVFVDGKSLKGGNCIIDGDVLIL